jgi:hypothetical protein
VRSERVLSLASFLQNAKEMLGIVRQQAADDVAQQRAAVVLDLDRVFSNDAEGREQRIAHAHMPTKERGASQGETDGCLCLVCVCVSRWLRLLESFPRCVRDCVHIRVSARTVRGLSHGARVRAGVCVCTSRLLCWSASVSLWLSGRAAAA